MRIFYLLGSFALIGTFLSGCSCERDDDNRKKAEDLSRPPRPLVAKPVPEQLKVEVSPQVGATDARPIAIVVAKDPSFCSTIRGEWKFSGHVLCTDQPLDLAETRLKRAVSYLKETYPRHTGKAPVHLFTDPARSEVGWRLMLKEPGFFSYGYLPGLEEKKLTNTTLAALHSRGARVLVLGIEESKRLEILRNVASRRGLSVVPLGSDATLKKAVTFMKGRDARLAPPPQPVKRPPPPKEPQPLKEPPPLKEPNTAEPRP